MSCYVDVLHDRFIIFINSLFPSKTHLIIKNIPSGPSLNLLIWNISHIPTCQISVWRYLNTLGGGPRVMVSTAAFHAKVRGSVPGLGGLKETKNVSSPSTCESQYCGEPPWPRGSVLGFRPPGLEFRILCLEDSVISIISPSSEGSPGPV